jgi:Ca-activated chloride channel family protein
MVRPDRATHIGLGAVVFCVGIAASLLAWGQGVTSHRRPTFPVGIELIRLSVSVTDDRNHYVGGLAESDFAVFEDGVRQELSFFTREPLPLSVALLIDCSASMDEKLPVAQAAGVRFFRTLGPEDAGQVVQFNDRIVVLQDFTSARAPLEEAINRTTAAGPTALYNALYVTLKQLRSHGSPGSPRRRAIVLLSDGEDTASLASDDQVLEQARQAEIGVYAIALRPGRPQDRQRQAFSQATYFLKALARETGGQAYFPDSLSELDGVYGRVAEELRTQYTLGYVSSNTRRDGKWRRIVIRTLGREDLQVRHKLTYQAPMG